MTKYLLPGSKHERRCKHRSFQHHQVRTHDEFSDLPSDLNHCWA
jgi:hypothetical protein